MSREPTSTTKATLTLRCPEHIVATDVIGAVEGPVVITVPPAAAGELRVRPSRWRRNWRAKVDLAFEAGPTAFSKPSTMLKVSGDHYESSAKASMTSGSSKSCCARRSCSSCSGNTCRSPMAEAIARHLLAEKEGVSEPELEKKGISVLSAGAFAMPGARATPQAVDAVRTLGADLSSHRSRP